MSSSVARAREILRESGPGGLWWSALGVTVYRRLDFFSRGLDQAQPSLKAHPELSFELLGPDTVADYLRLRPEVPRSEVERRLGAGQSCLLGSVAGEPVTARWSSLARAESPYLGLSFELEPGVAYVYDVFTARAARQRGMVAAARARAEAMIREQGATTLLGTVMPGNLAGLGIVQAAGYRPIGRVGCVRLGPLRLPSRRISDGYLGRSTRLDAAWSAPS